MNAEQLKNSILQRAIEGKLVEQREEEGSAAELLKEIKAEKARLVKEGKIKKEKPLRSITAEEIPFEIPESWEWVRLGNIGVLERGSGLKRNETTSTGKPCIRYGELYTTYRTRFTTTMSFTSPEVFEQCRKVSKNDIVMSLTGENKHDIAMAVAYEGDDEIAMGGDMARWFAHGMNPLYLTYLLNSPYGISCKQMRATGNIIVHISGSKLSEIPLPIPPLAEQKRIVAKIEELLPHVEQYGKAHDELTALNTKFPEAMKKSVLQYAMEGKLVEQREEEGTAKELLKEIDKYNTKIPPCKSELDFSAMDYNIPDSWSFVELNRILRFVDYRGKTPHKSKNGVFLITASNIKKGYMDYTRKEYISYEEYQTRKERGITEKEDLLFTTEAPMGNSALCNLDECSCGQRIITFKEYHKETVNLRLMMYFILSPRFQQQLLDNCTGTTAKGIKAEKLKHFLVPLPPLAEQKRIVAKIEELLACCGALEKA